jgi:hypothetical protein
MPAEDNSDKIHLRMEKIREISDGIFDRAERKAVLDLVKDYEKLTLAEDQ